MRKPILIIHGGNVFANKKELIDYFQKKVITLDDLKLKDDWKVNLKKKLKDRYEVFLPKMPLKENGQFFLWKITFDKVLALFHQPLILIGHSLGGIFLIKYLSENNIKKKIRSLLLVASPFNNIKLKDFNFKISNLKNIEKKVKEIVFFHSQDDEIVPYDDFLKYQKYFKKAKFFSFEKKDHFRQKRFKELEDYLQNL